MTKALLPQAFWFRIAALWPRVEEMPRPNDKKRLLDLPPSCTLPMGLGWRGWRRGPRSASRGTLEVWGSR